MYNYHIIKVQIQAVKAICAFILHHEKVVEIQKQFSDLLPNMMRVRTFILNKIKKLIIIQFICFNVGY